jgi:hypothetical protein
MSADEKPATKILVTVTSGLILAALVYVFRRWLPPLLGSVSRACGVACSWVMSTHATPGWLLIPLSAAAIWCIIKFGTRMSRVPNQPEPHWRDFRAFEYMGVLWRWEYSSRGDVHSLVSFCPQEDCDMQTFPKLGHYYGPGRESTKYPCDRCGHTPEIESGQYVIESRVTREIQRLLRSDAWKQHLLKA